MQGAVAEFRHSPLFCPPMNACHDTPQATRIKFSVLTKFNAGGVKVCPFAYLCTVKRHARVPRHLTRTPQSLRDSP